MRRRESLAVLLGGATALALPSAARAQEPAASKSPRIGVLVTGLPRVRASAPIQALLEGLRELGYVDGQTVQIEYRWAEGKPDALPELAADLVRNGVDLIVSTGDAPTRAARAATTTLPIVMATSGDALGAGFVASLARPGGNITGMTAINPELGAKRLQLLKELLPKALHVAVVWNPSDVAHTLDFVATQLAAVKLGVTLRPVEVRASGDIDKGFAALRRDRVDAIVVFNDTTTLEGRAQILQLIDDARLPAVYEASEWADAGGLMAYGVTHADLFRRSAVHIDKILKGVRPADLPIEQPTWLRLTLNLKTAMALGVAIPPALRLRADKVIE